MSREGGPARWPQSRRCIGPAEQREDGQCHNVAAKGTSLCKLHLRRFGFGVPRRCPQCDGTGLVPPKDRPMATRKLREVLGRIRKKQRKAVAGKAGA